MELERNPITRSLFVRLLQASDKVLGKPFREMQRVKQISVYACGPATLQMLFSFVGVRVSQKSLIRSIRAENKIRLWGIDVKDMAKATRIAGKHDFVFWKKQRANVTDLHTAINKYKWPVGVEWQGVFYENEDEDSGHYGVVTRIDKSADYLRIADPYFNGIFGYNGVDRRFGIREFVRKWWDTNEVKVAGTSKTRTIKDVRMMFVITPKGTSWPKKLGMVRASSI